MICADVNYVMHIAHYSDGEILTVEQLSKLVGLQRRQVANLARKEKVPGVTRPNGWHYQYRMNPDLRIWIQVKRSEVARKKRPPAIPNAKRHPMGGLASVHGIRADFEIWLRRVGGLAGILKMPSDNIMEIIGEIQPIGTLYLELGEKVFNGR